MLSNSNHLLSRKHLRRRRRIHLPPRKKHKSSSNRQLRPILSSKKIRSLAPSLPVLVKMDLNSSLILTQTPLYRPLLKMSQSRHSLNSRKQWQMPANLPLLSLHPIHLLPRLPPFKSLETMDKQTHSLNRQTSLPSRKHKVQFNRMNQRR